MRRPVFLFRFVFFLKGAEVKQSFPTTVRAFLTPDYWFPGLHTFTKEKGERNPDLFTERCICAQGELF